jgi:predicted ribosome quality control (RQC) complex YloA/Tae2 family protein
VTDDPAGRHRPGHDSDDGFRVIRLGAFEILIGKGARDNDRLAFRVARPTDLWFHAAGYAGSHVLVRAVEGKTEQVPAEVAQRAAEYAVWYSKAREARGKVGVHLCRARDLSKRKGAPAGQVMVRGGETIRVYAREPQPGIRPADDDRPT